MPKPINRAIVLEKLALLRMPLLEARDGARETDLLPAELVFLLTKLYALDTRLRRATK